MTFLLMSTSKVLYFYSPEMMHLSYFQINKITKETIGKTCSQIINEQILLEAKRNLLGTPNQIHQIDQNLGYEDTRYFIRFFKKHAGVAPETFRKNFKQVLYDLIFVLHVSLKVIIISKYFLGYYPSLRIYSKIFYEIL